MHKVGNYKKSKRKSKRKQKKAAALAAAHDAWILERMPKGEMAEKKRNQQRRMLEARWSTRLNYKPGGPRAYDEEWEATWKKLVLRDAKRTDAKVGGPLTHTRVPLATPSSTMLYI